MESEFDNETGFKYSNLRLKSNCDLKNIFGHDHSEDSEYSDSGSEYLPPTKKSMRSDEEMPFVPNINLDQFVSDDEFDLIQPSTSAQNEMHSVSQNEELKSIEKNIQGYNFCGTVETSRKNQINNKRRWDKSDNCIFCEKNVTNFTRHIIRKHSSEMEVIRFSALRKGSKERKDLADLLRKRGNFLSNVGNEQYIKPVRRPNAFSIISPTVKDYLPCKYCYGFYKKTYSYRHEKKCKNVKTAKKGRNNARAYAHNLLFAFDDDDAQLLAEVFPRRAADNISTIAKTDKLIILFGARYLKSHHEKHLINVVSQKMRTLARLVIQMQIEEPSIKALQDCLVPKYFDIVVKSTKALAGYNALSDKFEIPSLVLKIGNSL